MPILSKQISAFLRGFGKLKTVFNRQGQNYSKIKKRALQQTSALCYQRDKICASFKSTSFHPQSLVN